jgi:hypothetical protein
MKTYKQKLIEFMWAKEKIIAEYKKEEGLYFKKEDEKIIEGWDEHSCTTIYEIIVSVLHDRPSCEVGLFANYCPFCLYIGSRNCIKCLYKNNHGGLYCDEIEGPAKDNEECEKDRICGGCWENCCTMDYIKITDDYGVHKLFTKEVYVKIILDIEG